MKPIQTNHLSERSRTVVRVVAVLFCVAGLAVSSASVAAAPEAGAAPASGAAPAAAAAPSSSGAEFSVLGASTVGKGRHVIGGNAGLPHVEFNWMMGVTDKIDIGARASFYYVFPYYEIEGTFGDEFSFLFRLQLLKKGAFSMALRAELGAHLNYEGDVNFGLLLLQPTLMFGYDVSIVHLFGGLGVPVLLIVDPVLAYIPIAFTLGTEIRLMNNLHLAIQVKVGPSIGVLEWVNPLTNQTERVDDTSYMFNATVGIHYRL